MFCAVPGFRHAPNRRQPTASTSRGAFLDPIQNPRPNTQCHCPHARTPANQSLLQFPTRRQPATATSRLSPTTLIFLPYFPLKTASLPDNTSLSLQAFRQTLQKLPCRGVLPQASSSANRTPFVTHQSRVREMRQTPTTLSMPLRHQSRAAVSQPLGDSGHPESEVLWTTD